MCQGNFLLDTTIELKNNMNENEEENFYFLEVEQIDDESFNEFMNYLMLQTQEWIEFNVDQEIRNALIQE
jgi:hypothetical protein